ncbi:MAG: hypothetical protein WDO18_20805 [Acidobacteriota bacterium]
MNATLTSQGIKGAYYATLGMTAITASGGTYTFAGAGGADVGAFTSTITLSNPLLTWPNQKRGGHGGSNATSDGDVERWESGKLRLHHGDKRDAGRGRGRVHLPCTGKRWRFTVPAYILSALPAGNGGTELQNYVYGTLNPSELDLGLAFADIAISAKSTYR